jgi:hypothetical protein
MPRVEYAHAIYHVINRGNYRSAIFASVGAAGDLEGVGPFIVRKPGAEDW